MARAYQPTLDNRPLDLATDHRRQQLRLVVAALAVPAARQGHGDQRVRQVTVAIPRPYRRGQHAAKDPGFAQPVARLQPLDHATERRRVGERRHRDRPRRRCHDAGSADLPDNRSGRCGFGAHRTGRFVAFERGGALPAQIRIASRPPSAEYADAGKKCAEDVHRACRFRASARSQASGSFGSSLWRISKYRPTSVSPPLWPTVAMTSSDSTDSPRRL